MELLAVYFAAVVYLLSQISVVYGTNRYYGTYTLFGSGDTIIQTFHAHMGPATPNRKWNLECLDGEAMVGIQDWQDDFGRIQQVWCKFMFPNKPPTQGLYPYFPGCHVRNYTTDFFCFDPTRTGLTSHTFVTGLWQSNLNWWVLRIPADNVSLMKCCKAPFGYYIDYVSCYWQPTHDMYFEYYNSANHFIVQCATSYVMTGMSKKVNPWKKDNIVDWIQCCRVGFGRPQFQEPPMITTKSGAQVYYDSTTSQSSYGGVPSGYRSQYKSRSGDPTDNSVAPAFRNGTVVDDLKDQAFVPSKNRRKRDVAALLNAHETII